MVDPLSDLYAHETTFVESLRRRVEEHPDNRAYTFLTDGETDEIVRTYRDLDRRAKAIAGRLQSLCNAGDRVLLLFQPGLEFLDAFFGCLYAGVVAVPANPPRPNRSMRDIGNIALDAQSTMVLSAGVTAAELEPRFDGQVDLSHHRFCASDEIDDAEADSWQPPKISDRDLAFLQYTSGSTGTPKGVMVTHSALLAQERIIWRAFENNTPIRHIGCGWLPLFHDMGLIGLALQSVYMGAQNVLMSPVAFLQKPVRWLDAISRYRVTTSGGPNFAYELCVRSVTDEQKEKLDLRSWDLAFTGAEPVNPDTLRRFTEAFAVCGFRPQAFYPCYGLAEATLMVTGSSRRSMPVVRTFDSRALLENRAVVVEPVDGDRAQDEAEDAGPDGEDKTRRLIGCGRVVSDTTLAIVDPTTHRELEDGRIGEIWVSGPAITAGYWNRADATAETFGAQILGGNGTHFLRTGDLGFLDEGELFITGRQKNVIIIRGRNYYPQDIEATVVGAHPALKAHGSAAFTVEGKGDQRLVIVQEVQRSWLRNLDAEEVSQAVCQAVALEHDLQVDAVLLLKTSGIPKTSSGKIKHHACRQGFLADTLPVVGRWQRSKPVAGDECKHVAHAVPLSPESARMAKAIEAWLIEQLASRLGVANSAIDVKQPFARYGLDSVSAVNLSENLGQWLGRSLEPTLAYDYPNVELLARHLADHSAAAGSAPSIGAEPAEPLAIVGLGCRFPGADSPKAFWKLLREGVEAVGPLPPGRRELYRRQAAHQSDENQAGRLRGGFLDNVDRFDPALFGISPAEATYMDPQQRLLLEVAWESLEQAGIAPDSLSRSRTGVFVGISCNDYSRLADCRTSPSAAYAGTGNALSVAANRISYVLDLRGPSWAVDTACSSSLVAVHQACGSLRRGECNLAIAGGVNLILTADVTEAFLSTGLLSPDGRCKTFDAAADGYVRGEGCGLIVLKRLADAVRDRDQIVAVIRGSAVNSDGRSNGLTAPNGPAQQSVVLEAMAEAGVEPSALGYVEAHGTGTALGDPIEVNSLKQVIDAGQSESDSRDATPCWLGSVKTNLGHLESAAGIAGLIKVALALDGREIPPHLHLNSLNENINLDESRLEIPTSRQPWPEGDRPRLAGVSSFGFGGTNAHVILEEAARPTGFKKGSGTVAGTARRVLRTTVPDPFLNHAEDSPERPLHVFTLSAADDRALRDSAARWADALEDCPEDSLADVCHTAAVGRAQLSRRLATPVRSVESLRNILADFAAGDRSGCQVSDEQSNWNPARLAFMFTGQGSQYLGMGSELYHSHPEFRRSIDRSDEILRPIMDRSLTSLLFPTTADDGALNQTVCTQPAIFALEYALAQLWRSWGIEPAILVGHSLGEYVAACCAGVFSLEDGLGLVAERGRLIASLPPGGSMAVVFAAKDKVLPLVEQRSAEASLAAINSPGQVVVSGSDGAIEQIVAELDRLGVESRRVAVSHAFHSPLIEPILGEFEACCRKVTFNEPAIEIISNADGNPVGDRMASPQYWCDHLRRPVEFARSIDTLAQSGVEVFLEIGPKPVLTALAQRCLEDDGPRLWLAGLDPKRTDWEQLSESLCKLFVRGAAIDWRNFDAPYRRRRLQLPTYPFQRERYWIDTSQSADLGQSPATAGGQSTHPLLGRRLRSAGRQAIYESRLLAEEGSPLGDHRIASHAVLSIGSYLEMALAAGSRLEGGRRLVVEQLAVERPLALPEGVRQTVQTVVSPEADGGPSFEVFGLVDDATADEAWVRHASGRVAGIEQWTETASIDLRKAAARCTESVSADQFYRQLDEQGFEFGPSLRLIEELHRAPGEALAKIRSPQLSDPAQGDYLFDPAVLDACLQTIAAAMGDVSEPADYLPVSVDRLTIDGPLVDDLTAYARIHAGQQSRPVSIRADVVLLTSDGRVIARLDGARLKRVNRESLSKQVETLDSSVYQIEWQRSQAQERPRKSLPAPPDLHRRLAPQAEKLESDGDLKRYLDLLEQLEKLSVGYIEKALIGAGWQMQLGATVTLESLAETLAVVDTRRRLLGRLLDILTEEEILTTDGGVLKVSRLPGLPDPQAESKSLLENHPEAAAELVLLDRCSAALADVLQGKVDALDVIFPGGDASLAEKLYRDSPGAAAMNGLVRRALAEIVAKLPGDTTLRVLEVGAGTGGTTAAILPELSAERTEYVFTDVSGLFVENAKDKFRQYPFVRYEVLDVEQSPKAQGFREAPFDVVVAANVLHTTRNLPEALANVRSLLSPGGLLVTLEGTRPQRWLDLIFGLTDGWWRFDDAPLRTSHPLLSESDWTTLLEDSGFSRPVVIAPGRGRDKSAGQAVIVAQSTGKEPAAGSSLRADWLILADRGGVGLRLAEKVRASGARATIVKAGCALRRTGEFEFEMSPGNSDDFDLLLDEIDEHSNGRLLEVVHLWSLDTTGAENLDVDLLESDLQLSCGSAAYLVQSLAARKQTCDTRLWLVTQGAQPVGRDARVPGVAQAPLWGLGTVIALEYPQLRCTRVDLDPAADDGQAESLWSLVSSQSVAQNDFEDRVAIRGSGRWLPRLVRSELPHRKPLELRPDATYLISGGLGVLGLRTADWMVDQGARRIALVGRTALPPRERWGSSTATSRIGRQTEAILAMEAKGAGITTHAVDVGNPCEVAALVDFLKWEAPPVRGIIHAAGVSEYRSIDRMTVEALDTAFRAKALGGWLLMQHGSRLPLDFFVSFSSTASLWGLKGQAHYAAANAFLDALAHLGRSAGIPVLAVNWGLWADGGMVDEAYRTWMTQIGMNQHPADNQFNTFGGQAVESYRNWLASFGIEELEPPRALEALGRLIHSDTVQVTVAKIDWKRFSKRYQVTRAPSLLQDISADDGPSVGGDESRAADRGNFRRRLAGLSRREREGLIVEHIRGEISSVVGIDMPDEDIGRPLAGMGLDSLMAIELRNRVKTSLDVDVPMVKFIEGLSVSDLALYLCENLGNGHDKSRGDETHNQTAEQSGNPEKANGNGKKIEAGGKSADGNGKKTGGGNGKHIGDDVNVVSAADEGDGDWVEGEI